MQNHMNNLLVFTNKQKVEKMGILDIISYTDQITIAWKKNVIISVIIYLHFTTYKDSIVFLYNMQSMCIHFTI